MPAKRRSALKPVSKSKRSHKTKKRLAVKREMLKARAGRKNAKKS